MQLLSRQMENVGFSKPLVIPAQRLPREAIPPEIDAAQYTTAHQFLRTAESSQESDGKVRKSREEFMHRMRESGIKAACFRALPDGRWIVLVSRPQNK